MTLWLLCASLLAFVPRPDPPGDESWLFRRELAEPQEEPGPEVGVDHATGRRKVPWLKHRISRCFFGPIKRPPYNRDELADDVDYYPSAYLERLRREGVNGLWLTVDMPDLDERRLAKLRATVEKCAANGIGIWVFGIEPRNRGALDRVPVCTATEAAREKISADFRRLFASVPGLAGYIGITHGEFVTSCLSTVSALDDESAQCPLCGRMPNWRIHWNTLSAIASGVRGAAPYAHVVSWLYQPKKSPVRGSWVFDCARHVPDGVTMMYNFESGLEISQCGIARQGGDYWLSQPGPGRPFVRFAAASHEANRPLFAKIQVACSHEDATVPYIPVPGLLYRKYRAMKACGVTGAMLCWYFGSYPGLMNRAAGELAYEDFSDGEQAFLARLARAEGWGEDSDEVVRLWNAFAKAYSDYPVSNWMQYYGPFHFGLAWELLPYVSCRGMEPTWVTGFPPAGDFVGEMLGDFSLDDALAQCEAMVAALDGVDESLESLGRKYGDRRERSLDIGVMKAVGMQFRSSRNILAFYRARREALRLGRAEGDPAAARKEVSAMRRIVQDEIGLSLGMSALCKADSRLGFHSEAEAHLFFPDRLAWRVGRLGDALHELDEIEKALSDGKPYPESETEAAAPRFDVSGEVPAGAERVTVYDMSGTVFPRIAEIRGGTMPFALKEGDFVIFHKADGTPVWPKTDKVRPRLWLPNRPEQAGRVVPRCNCRTGAHLHTASGG